MYANFYFLLSLEIDFGKLETSWPFIVYFYYKIIEIELTLNFIELGLNSKV